MTYTDTNTYPTLIQLAYMIPVMALLIFAVWSILTYIFNRLIDSAKDQNKKLLDNMGRLDKTQAYHDVACCDNDKPCKCGMKGKSLFSKIN